MGAFLDWTTTQLQTGTECSCCNGLNIISTDLVVAMWIFILCQDGQHSILQWKRNSSDTESLSSHSQLVQTPLPRSSLWHRRLRWLPGWAGLCGAVNILTFSSHFVYRSFQEIGPEQLREVRGGEYWDLADDHLRLGGGGRQQRARGPLRGRVPQFWHCTFGRMQ